MIIKNVGIESTIQIGNGAGACMGVDLGIQRPPPVADAEIFGGRKSPGPSSLYHHAQGLEGRV